MTQRLQRMAIYLHRIQLNPVTEIINKSFREGVFPEVPNLQ